MGKKSREYLAVKNFIHNEMGLSKDDFIVLMKEAIKDEASRFVRRELQARPPQSIINDVTTREVKRMLGSSSSVSRTTLFNSIGKEVAKKVDIKIVE